MSGKKKKTTKKAQKKQIARAVVIIAAVLAVGFSVTAVVWGRMHQHVVSIDILPEEAAKIAEEQETAALSEEEVVEPETEAALEEKPIEPLEIGKGSILVIIDDVGYNLHELEPFLSLPGPVVFAILPSVPYSRKAAEMIHDAGKTSIIHQPMQATTIQNLGDNPVLADMNEEEIDAVLTRSINEIPYAVGMNNHMGSLITADPEKMEMILRFLKEKGMIFVDSLTTADSAVKETAEKLGMPYLHRHVFLDNEKTAEYYTAAFESGLQQAEEEGLAVLIGHVWADGLAEALYGLYLEAEAEGVTFISINELEETVIRYAGIGN